MKIKSLILAFPVLCLACNNPSTPQDPASHTEANPIVAKEVVGVHVLTNDFNYEVPCNILDEEYIRGSFKIGETDGLEEILGKDGCEFKWGANRILLSFAGKRPFSSMNMAEYTFDRQFQNEPANVITEPVDVVTEETVNGPETQGTGAERPTPSNAPETPMMDDKHPEHAGITAPVPALTEKAESMGSFEAVPGVGDKAVWDPAKSAMHVLYNNHIINVVVETKEKADVRKERARTLAEVMIEKISANEYTTRM